MTPALLVRPEEEHMTKKSAPKSTAPTGDYVHELLAHDADLGRRVEEELAQMRVLQDLIRLRERRGLTQTQLARLLGISQSAVNQVESGKAKNMQIRTLVRFAAALGARLKIALELDPAAK